MPGPCNGTGHFIQAARAAEPSRRYAFAGHCLGDALGDALGPPFATHIHQERHPRDLRLVKLFVQADSGNLTDRVRSGLCGRVSVACLRMAVHLAPDGPRLLRFTRMLQRACRVAIHVETLNIAHAWSRWLTLTEKPEHSGQSVRRPQAARPGAPV